MGVQDVALLPFRASFFTTFLKIVVEVKASVLPHIINGINDINFEKFFEFTDYDGTRNSYTKLYIQYARTQSKKCTFSRRSAPVWNTKLSQLKKCCANVKFFKRLLDNETFFLENKFYFDQY